MAGLVEQLQADALDQSVDVSTLLRKVKVAAVKLQLSDTVEWADSELKGYDGEVPAYRVLSGRCMGLDAYHGWTVIGGDAAVVEALSTCPVGQPISGLEDVARSNGGTPMIPLPRMIVNDIIAGNPRCRDVALHVTRAEVIAVLDHVRNLVLDWALDLERAGIKGDGLAFTPSERELASTSHLNINIEGANARLNIGSADYSTNTTNGD